MSEQPSVGLDNKVYDVKDLTVYFKVKGRGSKLFVHAVDGVSLSVERGVSVGIVGESGSGKTTLGKTLVGLIKPKSGEVLFEGRNVFKLRGAETAEFRRKVQMIYQDPFDAIDPLFSVYDAVAEGLRALKITGSREEMDQAVYGALQTVRLTPPEEYAKRRITSLSGGQRQRVAVARSLAMEPEVLILDEPVSMLDASVRGEIIKIMADLKIRGKTFLMITHDVATVKFFAESIAVMYLGKIVELGSSEDVVAHPLHPYTQALIAAVPVPDPEVKVKSLAKGEIPSAIFPPSGCRFHPRCPLAQEICKTEEPALRAVAKNRYVACHFA